MQDIIKLSPLSLINKENIFIIKGRPAKEDVIKRLVQAVCQENAALNVQDVLTQVLRREEGISTTLDTGLSIPHARLEETEHFLAAMAILPEGATEPASGRPEMNVMFFFLSPAKSAFFQKHLQLLASLAETFTPARISHLSACTSAQEALSVLAEQMPPAPEML